MSIAYDDVNAAFKDHGANAGLDAALKALEAAKDHHGVFRLRLLQKRRELDMLLINPELETCADEVRAAYERFIKDLCAEIGARCLADGDLAQAWRYYETIDNREPFRDALEKLDPEKVTDEILSVALHEDAHPRRAFELAIAKFGAGRALSYFEAGHPTDIWLKREVATLMVRALYKDLLINVCQALLDKDETIPEQPELVELIRGRHDLFESGTIHVEAKHLTEITRLGMLCEDEPDLIMALSLCEYGRMLDYQHHPVIEAPFDMGFADYARYIRAVLGEDTEDTIEYFRSKLMTYGSSSTTVTASELILMLLWRLGRREDALDLWQHYTSNSTPDQCGTFIPSFYDLCIEAGAFQRLADVARIHDDVSAWAAARVMELAAPKPATQAPEIIAAPGPSA